jgi:hypothetical protein
MNGRKIVMTRLRMLCFAAGVALVAPLVVAPGQAQAQIDIGIDIGVAPPAPQVEVVPPPPPGAFVWEKGFWRWNRITGAHVWVPGHYIPLPHPGAVRVPAEWVQAPNGHWRFIPARWR